MNKYALTACAILIGTGTAFAGSDHYGSNNGEPTVNIDHSSTASVRKAAPGPYKGVDMKLKTGAGTFGQGITESGQGIWGN